VTVLLIGFSGLEFRDVLLFNFFSDSPAKNEWRVILEQVIPVDV
jgi:hypothetical protein